MLELRSPGTAVLVGALAIAGCGGGADEMGDDETIPDTIVVEEEGDLEGAVEETGEAMGEGMEEIGEAAEDVGEAVGEGAEEVGERAEDAVD